MKTFNDLIHQSEVPVLVDFYADWCAPCQVLAPVIKEVAAKMEGKIKVIKVDVDKNQSASAAYGIRSIPTIILFHEGKILWRHSGGIQAAGLMREIEKHLTQSA